MMTENGPFMTNDDSLKEALPYGNHSVPKLFHRDYHWAKSASYIWLESPAGVGFSYCDYGIMNKTTGAKYPCTANDTSTAKDNHEVLKAFFKGFPEFAKNDFFITGESYAGIYIPTLAEQIMLDAENKINLKGLAIGNGCWGSTVGLCSFGPDMDRVWQQFLYGHNAITPVAYKKIVKACGDPMDGPGSWSNCTGQGPVCPNMLKASDRYASGDCQSALNNVSADEFTGQGKTANYEIYNYYDTCYSTTDIRRRLEHEHAGMTAADRAAMIEHLRNGGEFGAAVHIGEKPLTAGGALNDYTCGGMGAMGKWLEQPEVITALHVENDGTHRYPGAVSYGPRTEGDLRPLYKILAQKYKLLIYSGGELFD
jgi:carboxypeptidase C (cathepsin A)